MLSFFYICLRDLAEYLGKSQYTKGSNQLHIYSCEVDTVMILQNMYPNIFQQLPHWMSWLLL